jgi:hypothetical protein
MGSSLRKSATVGDGRVRPLKTDCWRRAWRAAGATTYFHGPEWAWIQERYSGGRLAAEPVQLELADGTVAYAPLSASGQPRSLKGRYFSSAEGTYGGWFSDRPVDAGRSAALWHLLLSHKAPLQVRVNPFDEDQRAGLSPDAAASLPGGIVPDDGFDDVTHAIRLEGTAEELWRGWRKGHRSAVTKARREGVSTRLGDGEQDWRVYYAMYEEALSRWGADASSRYEWRLFELMSQARSADIALWLAEHDGRIVAGALCLYSPTHVSYWHGAAHRDAQELRPTHLLMYDAVADALQRGLRWFDFNPSGGHEQVEHFKRGFRPQQLSCPVIRTDRAWLSALRRVKGRLGR